MYRQPRMAASLALGFSSGLPFYLVFQTLSAWLRQAGVERATISMLAWVGLIYTIKFLWAPIVDRLSLPLLHRVLGRRRSWMLVAQIGVAFGLAYMAGQDPAANLFAVAMGALFVAFCAATQDIAGDAWRIESAPPEMQGGMAGAWQLGYRIAIMVSTAGALWIAADYGWRLSYATMALLMGVGMVTTLLTREPRPDPSRLSLMQEERVIQWLERRTHWPESLRQLGATFVGAVVCPLVDFFVRYGVALGALIFAFVCCYRLTDYAMGVMANPFYLDHGYTLKEVAAVVKGFGLFASLLGVLAGGVVVAKLGIPRAMVAASLLVIGSNLSFSLLATTNAPTLIGLALVNSFDNIALGMQGTALIAFLSSLTSARYTATQYAVLSSLYALPGKVLMGFSGLMVDRLDYPAFFVYTASLSLPGLLLLYFLMRRDPLRFRTQAS